MQETETFIRIIESAKPNDEVGLNNIRKKKGRSVIRCALFVLTLLFVCASAAAGVWYYRFTHYVPPQVLSHEVSHTMIPATLRNTQIQLHVYQQANATDQQLFLFTSGDGGWSPFCQDLAAHVASTGVTVVGFDAKDYMQKFAASDNPLLPEDIAKDYNALLDATLSVQGIDKGKPAVLAGWSLGAGYSVIAAALSPEFKSRVGRLVAISLPTQNELAWKPTDAIIYITKGVPREKVFDVGEYLPKVAPVPFIFINATDDTMVTMKEAQTLINKVNGAKLLCPVKAKDHRYKEGEAQFYQTLDKSITTAI